MYEMEGPRLVSRRRPADFSASFAPLDRLPGPVALPVFRLPGSPVWLGYPLAVAPGSPAPRRGVARCRWPGSSLVPEARGTPLAGWPGVAPVPVAPGAPLARRPEVFPLPWLRAVPCRGSEPPVAGGSGPFLTRGSEPPVAGWRRSCLLCRWRGVRSSPMARGCPLTGDSEWSLRRWLRGFPPFADGSGFPLRRLPFPVVGKVLRQFAVADKGFLPAISRFFGRPQVIHS
jgi:hypothetical protein